MKPIFQNLLTVMIMGCATRCASAFEFTVEGVVQMQGYRQGQLEGETNYNFTAEIRDCSSRIRVFGGRFATTEYNEYGWDATNSYMLIKLRDDRASRDIQVFEGGKFKTVTLDKPVKSVNDATLTIGLSELPEYGRGMEPIWLAYASACYYHARKSGNKAPAVWWRGVRVREDNVLFDSVWRQDQDPPHLLEFMADFTDGRGFEMTGNKLVPVRMLKPFDVPTTNSIYEVLSWTNISGLAVPTKFRVVRYVPDVTAVSTPILHKLEVYEGIAQSVRPVCAARDFAPKVPDRIPTQVSDERMMHDPVPAKAVAYFSPTGRVSKLEDLRKSDAYARAQKATNFESKPESTKLRIILIGCFLVALAFPVWLFVKRENKTE